MAITLGLVEAIDSNGVYVSMPGSRGVLRGPYLTLQDVAVGDRVLTVTTDDGETVAVSSRPGLPDAVFNVLDFGATGDGVTDDTLALQGAFDAAIPGQTLLLPAGKTFRHTGVLTVATNDIVITGGGTLLATEEETSAVLVTGDRVSINGVTFRMGATTSRWTEYEQMKLRIHADGVTVRNVKVDGSAAAGIHVDQSSNFLIEDVLVMDTRADAIHITYGSHHGRVVRPLCIRAGDDGVAVVSYVNDGVICHDIDIIGARQVGQLWGRAFSVVGGNNITFRDIESNFSAGAAIYIACEDSFNTYGVDNVLVDGAVLSNSNRQADETAAWRPSPAEGRIVHGAVILFNGQAAPLAIRNVTMRNVIINDTTPDGYDQVAIRYGLQENLAFHNFTIRGGSEYAWAVSDVPTTSIRRVGFWQDGFPLPDINGW